MPASPLPISISATDCCLASCPFSPLASPLVQRWRSANELFQRPPNSSSPPTVRRSNSEPEKGWPSFFSKTLSPSSPVSLATMRTEMDSSAMFKLIRKAKGFTPNEFIPKLRKLDLSADRCFVKFSHRFEAMLMRWDRSVIWFTVIDSSVFIFALSPTDQPTKYLPFWNAGKSEIIPSLYIPTGGITWTELQRKLVLRFSDPNTAVDVLDGHVRSVLAACMLCYQFEGYDVCALTQLLPEDLRIFESTITYDFPVDDDILTVLADPYVNASGQHHFDCAGGFSARVVSSHKMLHLMREPKPLDSAPCDDTLYITAPFLYGFGGIIDGDSSSGATVPQLREAINQKKYGKLFLFLKMLRYLAPSMDDNGTLDLDKAAWILANNPGCVLTPRDRRIRRFHGDEVVVREDGLYRTPGLRGFHVAGSAEANLLGFLKLGIQIDKPLDREDERLTKLSEVAQLILGEKHPYSYVEVDTEEKVGVKAPKDYTSDEVSIANTFAALLCRHFGLFTGYNKEAARLEHVLSRCQRSQLTMEADVYLPDSYENRFMR